MKPTFCSRVKNFVRKQLPIACELMMEPMLHWRYLRRMRRLPVVNRRLVERFGLVVQEGPFKGMKYVAEAMSSGFAPKILGCYESEICFAVHEAINANYQIVVDVGCAEGYYAVGFAVTSPKSHIFAFDIDNKCRSLCAQMAILNDASSRVTVRSKCDHASLSEFAGRSVLLFCDCEGSELDLLDPRTVPAMQSWDILVELHDCIRPGITETLLSRFKQTHEIKLIDSIKRNPRDFPIVNFLFWPGDKSLAVDDLRGTPQQWAWMRSRQKRAVWNES